MFEKVSLAEWKRSMQSKGFTDPELEKMYASIEIPMRGTPYSAGYDFRIPYDLTAVPGISYFVPSGIKADLRFETRLFHPDGSVDDPKVDTSEEFQMGYFLALYPRSSYGFTYGFKMDNTVGIIDADYYNNETNEGNIMVAFTVNQTLNLKAGDKFCQGIITPFMTLQINEKTARQSRSGGMGSTGK